MKLRHIGETDKTPYHYTECGLDDVYLMSGYEEVQVDDDVAVAVKHVPELHKAIGHALVTAKKVLSGKELRFLRKEMDLTQDEVARLVGVTDQSVARWEKDQVQIPEAADYLLRFVYLQHIQEKIDVVELIKSLRDRDSGRDEGFCFEVSKGGWKKCAGWR
jgi:DNA-binding transcriptional regulator YiaG